MGESSERSVAAVKTVEENDPKRIKFQDITEKGDEDRISALPDYLLVEILSCLPSTKEAITTGTLCKRWKHLWTAVHTLIFTDSVFGRYLRKPNLRSDYVSFVDKTLAQCRQLKLKKFKAYIRYSIQFESQFNNWIGYAISCNVEELVIRIWYGSESKYLLHQKVFTSSCFTDLTLGDCLFNPTGAICWKNLKRLWISNGKLDEDLIENILCGSPVLETLVLNNCHGYRWLNITSSSVEELEFNGYMDHEYECDDIIDINAPNILSLKIQGSLLLWKVLLLDVSSVVEANLNYQWLGEHGETAHGEAEEEMLKGFILNLSHVKEIKIGGLCTKALSRLEAKGFVIPSNIKFSQKMGWW